MSGWNTYPTTAEGKMKWEVKQVRVQGGVNEDQIHLYASLEEGFEPFAVTGERGDVVYHMKRKLYWEASQGIQTNAV
jgi:hypothetical protein